MNDRPFVPRVSVSPAYPTGSDCLLPVLPASQDKPGSRALIQSDASMAYTKEYYLLDEHVENLRDAWRVSLSADRRRPGRDESAGARPAGRGPTQARGSASSAPSL